MSRFFATGSDSESESSSEEEIVQHQPVTAFTFSDGEEDVKRTVRSAKEKRFEELTNIIKNLRNYKKIKDLSSMLSSFEDLMRAYAKAVPVIMKEENGESPRFYVHCLVEMEDFINEVWDDKKGRQNMSKINSKSLATFRQKLRKYNKEFQEDLLKFRENPDLPDEEEDEEEDDREEDEKEFAEGSELEVKLEVDLASAFRKGTTVTGTENKKNFEDDDSSGDDSSEWSNMNDDSSESSGDEGPDMKMRDHFLKPSFRITDKQITEKRDRKGDRIKHKKEKEKKQVQDEDEDDGDEWTVVNAGPIEKLVMFSKDAEIDANLVVKKLAEILAARGKKRTDRRQQIELLHELLAISQSHNLGPAVALKIKFGIVSSVYDYNPKVSDAMKPELWQKLLLSMEETIQLILSTPNLTVSELVQEDSEVFDNPPYFVRGNILTTIERLDEEFVKLLKECDPHSNEYVDRLKDEIKVVKLIDQVQEHLEKHGTPSELCRIYMQKIEHLYYKFDPDIHKQKQGELPKDFISSVNVMDQLCKFVYEKDATHRLRARAILSHSYHHALHDNWFQARDLMLMSHLQETIQHSDPATQILYNRTMAHLGMCAFRHTIVKDAHNCLVDLMMTGRVKEHLAQGLLLQRQHERSKEQEKIEKQRQMPFHMHINLEVLECVYLVSAMLMEIPYMAAHEFDARRRMISKTFYQQLRTSERQSLVGPPESMREHIVAASKAMRNGNWQACVNFIINEKMNAKVWDLFHQADNVREMLTRIIKEETLRTYLFTYSHVYDSISMPTLSEMFELKLSVVHSIISKMIINEELMASLDDPTQTVMMHRSEPTRLQSLALQLADKVANFVDANERIFETRQGNVFNRSGNQMGFRDRQGQGQGQEWNRQRRDWPETRNY